MGGNSLRDPSQALRISSSRENSRGPSKRTTAQQSSSLDRSCVPASACEVKMMYNHHTLECPSVIKHRAHGLGIVGSVYGQFLLQGWKKKSFPAPAPDEVGLCLGSRYWKQKGMMLMMMMMITQGLWLNSDKLRVMRLHSERDVFVFSSKTSKHFNPQRAVANLWRDLDAGLLACVCPPAALALPGMVHYTEEGTRPGKCCSTHCSGWGELQNDLLNLSWQHSFLGFK